MVLDKKVTMKLKLHFYYSLIIRELKGYNHLIFIYLKFHNSIHSL
jgi:hypothetical protein